MPSAMSQTERTMAWPHLDVESKKARLQLAQWSPGAGRRRTVTTEYTGPALGRIGSGGLVCCVVPLRASEGAAFKCSDRHPRDKGVCEAEGVPTGLAGTCVSWSNRHCPSCTQRETKRVSTETYAPAKLSRSKQRRCWPPQGSLEPSVSPPLSRLLVSNKP